MPTTARSLKSLAAIRPVIHCQPLPDFDTHDLATVRAAFAAAAPCVLGQAWLPRLEPIFAPGQVRIGWRKDGLLVFAELTDHDIFSHATGSNQRMWELGDTFEIFLRRDGRPEYVELHVTPNNRRLQLRYPDAEGVQRARATNQIDAFLLPDDVFYSRTWVQPESKKWFVYAAIPAIAIGELQSGENIAAFKSALPGNTNHDPAGLKAGDRRHFSFSRYDATRGGGEPVISSTSPHPVADFHRQQDWDELTLVASKSMA